MLCKVDLDELHLAEVHIILQEMLEEGLIEEVDLGNGKVGYKNKGRELPTYNTSPKWLNE